MKGIVTFRFNSERYIRCNICNKYPLIVKRRGPTKPPAITTVSGTRFRSDILNDHIETTYHVDCLKAERLDSMVVAVAQLEIAVNKSNKRMVDYVGKLMIQIFHDAKRLNLSAYSWLSRYIAGEASHAKDSEKQDKSIIPSNISLQYVNPRGHLDLMTTISHRNHFLKKTMNVSRYLCELTDQSILLVSIKLTSWER